MHIQVKAINGHKGILLFREKRYDCALGKAGVTHLKKEGDHASPIGTFPLRSVYYRQDRLPEPPETHLPLHPISQTDGWCDDPQLPEYNRKVSLPFTGSHEVMAREDHLYDIVVILGHNDNPPVPGEGSCIFMHVATEEYSGTEGCVALAKADLLELLKTVSTDTLIEILPN
ncbi:L,D-transpeptidase family protein [Sneathiella limimaris]|uniref:L,D-transpeptidase family protein n=1 Tax=Sneathiella limimaris TaxID=1964213 RepID=UPI00146C127D|nr:L,D-transpeptidase family protein [Sneathiella limimaris]